MADGDFERDLAALLMGAKKTVVMAVGDELDPRDCLGYLAGKEIESLRLKNLEVLITAQMPENFTSKVRSLKPSHVVLIDSAEMERSAGYVAIIDPGRISATRVSTHAMPLSVLMEYLRKEFGMKVALIGIQPGTSEQASGGVQPPEVMEGIVRIGAAFAKALRKGIG